MLQQSVEPQPLRSGPSRLGAAKVTSYQKRLSDYRPSQRTCIIRASPRFRRRSTSGRPSRSARRNTMSPRPRTWIPNTGARRRTTKRKGPSSPRPRRITIPIVPIAPISIPTSLVWVQDLRSYSWTLPPRGGPHKFPRTLDGAPASTRDAAPTPSTLLSKRAGRCVKTASCLYLQVSPYLRYLP